MPKPSRQPLNAAEVQTQLPHGWTGDQHAIQRQFTFPTYQAGVTFTQQVAALAEQYDHHPDILLGYKRVTVTFSTHDAGGVTPWDIRSAQAINGL